MKVKKQDGTPTAYTFLLAEIVAVACDDARQKLLTTVKLHLKTIGGRGRFVHLNRSMAWHAERSFQAYGTPYTTGNDASRSGECGDFIEVKIEAAERFVRDVTA